MSPVYSKEGTTASVLWALLALWPLICEVQIPIGSVVMMTVQQPDLPMRIVLECKVQSKPLLPEPTSVKIGHCLL